MRYEFKRGRLFRSLLSKINVLLRHKQPAAPTADGYYGEKARLYQSSRVRQPHWPVEQASVSAFLQQLPPNLNLLDMPMGTGRFVEMCLKRNHSVTGLDKSEDMLDAATSLLGDRVNDIEIQTGTALELPFKDNAFDLTICYRFLGSVVPLEDAEIALAEVARVTSGHGILEIKHLKPDVPRRNGLTMKHRLYIAEVDSLLEAHGFEIIDSHMIFDRELEACRSVLVKTVQKPLK